MALKRFAALPFFDEDELVCELGVLVHAVTDAAGQSVRARRAYRHPSSPVQRPRPSRLLSGAWLLRRPRPAYSSSRRSSCCAPQRRGARRSERLSLSVRSTGPVVAYPGVQNFADGLYLWLQMAVMSGYASDHPPDRNRYGPVRSATAARCPAGRPAGVGGADGTLRGHRLGTSRPSTDSRRHRVLHSRLTRICTYRRS